MENFFYEQHLLQEGFQLKYTVQKFSTLTRNISRCNLKIASGEKLIVINSFKLTCWCFHSYILKVSFVKEIIILCFILVTHGWKNFGSGALTVA